MLSTVTAWAQNKPALVLAIASPQELVNDAEFVMNSIGTSEFVPIVKAMAGGVMPFLDATQPIGVTVSIDPNGGQSGFAFLPIKELDAVMKVIPNAPPLQDVGNGVKKLSANGQEVFLRSQGSFVFLAQRAEMLANVPANPVTMLGGLEKQFNVAVQVNVQAIPEQLRQMVISQVEEAAKRAAAEQGGDNPELRRQVTEQSVKNLRDLMRDAEQFVIGLQIDQQQRVVHLDGVVTAKQGSEMAEQMRANSANATQFGGFDVNGAAAVAHVSSKVGQKQLAQLDNMLALASTQIAKQIENDGNLPTPQAKAAIKGLVEQLLKVVRDTARSGKLDGGGVLMMGAGQPVQVALGGFVAEGAEVDAMFRKLVDLAKNEPQFPPVQFEAATHRDVKIHTLTIPVKDAEAQRVLGPTAQVALGTGPKSFYFAFGGDGVSLIKQVMDGSTQPKPTPPAVVRVALTPILQFVSSQDANQQVAKVLSALTKNPGLDHIIVSSTAASNTLTYRLELEYGVLAAIGGLR